MIKNIALTVMAILVAFLIPFSYTQASKAKEQEMIAIEKAKEAESHKELAELNAAEAMRQAAMITKMLEECEGRED